MERGNIVKVLDIFATGKIENLLHLLEKYPETLTLQVGDILNIEDCRKATEGIEYVFTRTALSSVPRSIKDPITSDRFNDYFCNCFGLNNRTASRNQICDR